MEHLPPFIGIEGHPESLGSIGEVSRLLRSVLRSTEERALIWAAIANPGTLLGCHSPGNRVIRNRGHLKDFVMASGESGFVPAIRYVVNDAREESVRQNLISLLESDGIYEGGLKTLILDHKVACQVRDSLREVFQDLTIISHVSDESDRFDLSGIPSDFLQPDYQMIDVDYFSNVLVNSLVDRSYDFSNCIFRFSECGKDIEEVMKPRKRTRDSWNTREVSLMLHTNHEPDGFSGMVSVSKIREMIQRLADIGFFKSPRSKEPGALSAVGF